MAFALTPVWAASWPMVRLSTAGGRIRIVVFPPFIRQHTRSHHWKVKGVR
jgi:hypothetical protein